MTRSAMRALIVVLAVAAGLLCCAIYLEANSTERSREAALAEAESQATQAGKDAAQRIEALERENADLGQQLKVAKGNLDLGAKKIAAVEQEALQLRSEIDAALKQVAELSQKYADARIKKAEESRAVAVRPDPVVTVVKPPAAKVEVVQPGKRHVAVASLPRTSPSFSELDKDQDGRLSLQEYKAGFPNDPNAEAEFKALDTNGDGYLSIDEYKAGHPDPGLVPIATKRGKKN